MSGAEPCTGSKRPGPPSREARRRRQPEPAGDRGGEVGEDVAEHVLGDDDVELLAASSRAASRRCRRACARRGRPDTRAPPRRRCAATAATSRARSPCRPTSDGRAASARARNARRAIRSTWRGWYSHVSNDGPVVAHAARAEVEAADELAHDQHVDVAGDRRTQVRVRVERGAQAEQPLLRPHVGARRTPDRRPGPSARRPRRGTRRASRRAAACRSRGSPRRRSAARRARRRARAASSTSRASAATSGPMPSPGRRTTRRRLPVGKCSLAERARLAAARARREARRLHRLVPAAEHAATVCRDGWFSPA